MSILKNILNHPVTLDSKPGSPSIPAWGAVLALLLPVSGGVAVSMLTIFALSEWVGWVFIGLALFGLIAFLYAWRSEGYRKFIKSAFDVSWNIWSLAGVTMTAYKLAVVVPNLSELPSSFQPLFITSMVGWAVTTAVGRAAIALMDCGSTWRKRNLS